MDKKVFTVLFAALLIFGVLALNKAYAHCDTLDGPVIQDARQALEKGDVTAVLKWVKKDAEPEICAAFDIALKERKTGKEGADTKFFETLVRVHRAGEGAEFSGLKPAGAVEPAVAAADKALESGSVNELASNMAGHLTNGVKERFARALESKKHKDESVEAGREFVEAYIEFVHYVEGLHQMISGKSAQHQE